MINLNVVVECSSWNRRIKENFFFFRSLVNSFPKKYKFNKKNPSLTILLSNNINIKKLNKKFRNKNKPTDVLSFPSEKKIDIKKNYYLGDIIISYEFMNDKKTFNNLEFKKKVAKTFVHGFLHLLGYDHVKLKDFQKMIKEEEKICAIINTKMIKSV